MRRNMPISAMTPNKSPVREPLAAAGMRLRRGATRLWTKTRDRRRARFCASALKSVGTSVIGTNAPAGHPHGQRGRQHAKSLGGTRRGCQVSESSRPMNRRMVGVFPLISAGFGPVTGGGFGDGLEEPGPLERLAQAWAPRSADEGAGLLPYERHRFTTLVRACVSAQVPNSA